MPDPATLTASDFASFYHAVHGHDPFAWQQELAVEVLGAGCWPDLIDVPTALGKTSMLDVAVFVAAATAHVPGAQRLGRRRCFFVVDRRIVVDEAFTHAQFLAAALAAAERSADEEILGRVAAGLRSYAPAAAGELLPVTRMRGGLTWASAWLDRPDRPGIVLGTVDQVGSRLLFRGYGVSDRRRPIDAALVGTDSLVLVDEAHLATPLLTTVAAARQRDQLGVPLPAVEVVRLSATGGPSEHTFTLDVEAHRSDPVAWRRLTAGKRLTTRETTAKNCVKVLAETALEHLAALIAAGGSAPTAAVVCNTVDRARTVHTLISTLVSASGAAVPADCELLIGRSRPLDRPMLGEQVLARFGTGRGSAARAAVIVATQTVEVGVNLDVDILVTESASWEALVQRLGRLNRLGAYTDRFPGHTSAAAVVVHDGQDEGPVYGRARDATWHGLHTAATHAGIDVSPLACRELTATLFAGPEFTRQPAGVPVLLAPTLDTWVQTGPVPLNDPPIAPFLHGFDAGPAAVQLLWRDGLLSDAPIDDPFDDNDGAELAAAQVDALLTQWPLRTAESVEVPFMAVKQWIAGQAPDPISDLETTPDTATQPRRFGDPFRVLAQRPGSARAVENGAPDTPTLWRWIGAEQLRPGDRVVVPTQRGGLDIYGWSPTDPTPVRDVSEMATFASRSRRPAALRLDTALISRLGLDDATTLRNRIVELEDGDADAPPTTPSDATELATLIADALPEQPSPTTSWSAEAWRTLRRWLRSDRLRIVEMRDPTDSWIAGGGPPRPWGRLLAGPLPSSELAAAACVDRDDEEVGASSISTVSVTLAVHHDAVRRRAEEIADALGLPDVLRAVVADAAAWHDLGKVEQRFQIMLHDGDAVEAALAREPLAKSGMNPTDRLGWRRAAQRSGLPAGARHEAWSAALVEEYLREANHPGDTELLLHLVASHHGYARPLARLVMDKAPHPVEALIGGEKVTVSSQRTVSLEHPARFTRLNHRYGRWGLALLETIIRCADTTISGEGS